LLAQALVNGICSSAAATPCTVGASTAAASTVLRMAATSSSPNVLPSWPAAPCSTRSIRRPSSGMTTGSTAASGQRASSSRTSTRAATASLSISTPSQSQISASAVASRAAVVTAAVI
jgi:hypothetical protein